jgi:hypothetical protein
MVRDMWELGMLLREATSILSERFSRFLLAFFEIPRVARADVSPLEVPFEHPDQVSLVVDLVGRELLELSTSGVGEEEW